SHGGAEVSQRSSVRVPDHGRRAGGDCEAGSGGGGAPRRHAVDSNPAEHAAGPATKRGGTRGGEQSDSDDEDCDADKQRRAPASGEAMFADGLSQFAQSWFQPRITRGSGVGGRGMGRSRPAATSAVTDSRPTTSRTMTA